MTRKGIFIGISMLGVMALSFIELRHAMPEGIGLSPDSVVYISVARNILQGKGFSTPAPNGQNVPLVHFPPGYPLSLAVASQILHRDVIPVAEGLQMLFLGLTVAVLAGWIGRRTGSTFAAVITAALLMSSIDLIHIHTMAWSEGLFLLLTFSGLALLDSYLLYRSWGILALSAGLIGLAWLTRYAGIAGVAAGVISLWVCSSGPWSRRVTPTVVFGGIAVLPMSFWLIRNTLLTHHATTRVFVYHPLWHQMASAFSGGLSLWLFQNSFYSGTALIVTITAVGILIFLFRRYGRSTAIGSSWKVLAMMACCYSLLIIIMSLFFEAEILRDIEFERILSPLHVSLLLMGVLFIADGQWPAGIRHAVVAGAVGLTLYFGFTAKAQIRQLAADGQQYASRSWRTSPTLKQMSEWPDSLHVYTNGRMPAYLYAHRVCFEIPPLILLGTRQANSHFDEVMQRIRDEVHHRAAVVVYFDDEARSEYPTAEQLEQILSAPKKPTEDGVIFGL